MKQKNKNLKSGFTLLELLVVVIIIGILAAIALPQYKLSVEKAKLSRYLSIGQSIRNAEEVFYMTNGYYSGSLLALDIDMNLTSLCESRTGSNIFYNCFDKSIKIDNGMGNNKALGAVGIDYCPSLANKKQSSWQECDSNRDLSVVFYFSDYYYDASVNNQIKCVGVTDKGKRLCKALGFNI